ncbi:MAG: hypothetical protein QNJ72_17005 [Pleurocapsa sp. MO_226.B13]|nr:hypothetical protein [Pleurocapsa sp. MO_226.B13]
MIARISELQPDTIQTIRGNVSQIEIEDDEFTLSNTSGSIEVDVDLDDLENLDDDDDDDGSDNNNLDNVNVVDDIDLNNFLNEINGQEATVVGELDDDDVNDLDFDALRITASNGSVVFEQRVLEDANVLGVGDDNFVQNTPDAIIINGGIGNDNLTGAEGSDFLIGGAGDDLLRGTGGFDTFMVGNGADIIVDFEPADVIVDLGDSFDDIGQILGEGGAATQVGQDTVINLGDDDSVTLLNFAVDDLTAANFALI